MSQFLKEHQLDNTLDFTKEQKLKLMQFATSDTNFLDRCDIIKNEFNDIDAQYSK